MPAPNSVTKMSSEIQTGLARWFDTLNSRTVCLAIVILAGIINSLRAETPVLEAPLFEPSSTQEISQDDRLERSVQLLSEENKRLSAEMQALRSSLDRTIQSPVTTDAPSGYPPAITELAKPPSDFYAGYDNGIFIRPVNAAQNPFSLRINHQNTFRYSGFDRVIPPGPTALATRDRFSAAATSPFPRPTDALGRCLDAGTHLSIEHRLQHGNQ